MSLSVHLNNYRFTFKFWPSMLVILLCGLLVGLGFWQLHRAEEKKALLANFAQGIKTPQLNLNDFIQKKPLKSYQAIRTQGHYLDKTFLLDNQFLDHKVGYAVITPFQVLHSGYVILVNRGFIERGKSRYVLPEITTPATLQALEGLSYVVGKQALLLKDLPLETSHWPVRIQRIDYKKMAAALGKPLQPFVILLSSQSPHGYQRHWKPQTMPPERHLAYALQWFSLATALVLLFLFSVRSIIGPDKLLEKESE